MSKVAVRVVGVGYLIVIPFIKDWNKSLCAIPIEETWMRRKT